MCTTEAACCVALPTSSLHWVSNGSGMRNWKRIGRVSSVLDVMGLALGGSSLKSGIFKVT